MEIKDEEPLKLKEEMKVFSERFCLPDSMMEKGDDLPEELSLSEASEFAQFACCQDLEKLILKMNNKVDYRGDKILAFLSSRKHIWNVSTINIS